MQKARQIQKMSVDGNCLVFVRMYGWALFKNTCRNREIYIYSFTCKWCICSTNVRSLLFLNTINFCYIFSSTGRRICGLNQAKENIYVNLKLKNFIKNRLIPFRNKKGLRFLYLIKLNNLPISVCLLYMQLVLHKRIKRFFCS